MRRQLEHFRRADHTYAECVAAAPLRLGLHTAWNAADMPSVTTDGVGAALRVARHTGIIAGAAHALASGYDTDCARRSVTS